MQEMLGSRNDIFSPKESKKEPTNDQEYSIDMKTMMEIYTQEIFDSFSDSIESLNKQIAGKSPEEIRVIIKNEQEEIYSSMLKSLPVSKALEIKEINDELFASIGEKIQDGHMSDQDIEMFKKEFLESLAVPTKDFSPAIDMLFGDLPALLGDLNQKLVGKSKDEIKIYLKNEFDNQQKIIQESNLPAEQKFKVSEMSYSLYSKIEEYTLDGNFSAMEFLDLGEFLHDRYLLPPEEIEKKGISEI